MFISLLSYWQKNTRLKGRHPENFQLLVVRHGMEYERFSVLPPSYLSIDEEFRDGII